ncbi:SDR family NAD(P)-dependent oxidoreductase [Pararobbsia silviterrae]|uniref:Glucose 1-dehydrogenase n=1 Tax=Pararobbsia silviterrae TaxID=1792498 RepID=A0A494XF71_9BURK|nr:glucose 1-dehydrogenase [Pararobbsia silviterrae]RKP46253.1 glucose 1-dehydrogenase [Pararobbsia silviterrae]
MSTILNQLFSLDGKVALVTGGGGAIGSELALALAKAGARIALHDVDSTRLERAKTAIENAGGTVQTFVADTREPEAAKRLVDSVAERFDGLDILVNSIGANRRKRIDAVTSEDFDAVVDVNFKSVYFLSQAVHPHLKRRGGGKIVHLSSLSAKHAFNTISVYAASKAAVSQLTRAQAHEWVADNIQVNAIEPGFVQTEFTRPLWDDTYRAQWFKDFIPAGRLAKPADLVGTLLLLVSPASAYITGQSIVVDGGVLSGATWEEPVRAA